MAKNVDGEDEDDELDQDDLEVIKEENKSEYDLQLSIAEIFGILFKTHGTSCGNLLNELFTIILPAAFNSEEKSKTKFGLFILDDMVEFLGPEILGTQYVEVAKQIIRYCNAPISALRQAAAYGIGMMAEKGGDRYAEVVALSLEGLKLAIDYEMPAAIKEKKAKAKQFMHARDNAVSALGKIIRF